MKHNFWTLFWISVIGFPILYGILRMYYYDLGKMFSREEWSKINKS